MNGTYDTLAILFLEKMSASESGSPRLLPPAPPARHQRSVAAARQIGAEQDGRTPAVWEGAGVVPHLAGCSKGWFLDV